MNNGRCTIEGLTQSIINEIATSAGVKPGGNCGCNVKIIKNPIDFPGYNGTKWLLKFGTDNRN